MKTIQNIVLDFDTDIATTFCEEHICYPEPAEINNKAALKSAVNSAFGVTASNIVIQYTEDQYGDNGPRIIVNVEGVRIPIIKTFVEITEDYTDPTVSPFFTFFISNLISQVLIAAEA